MSKPFFTMYNRYVESCGVPPAYSNDGSGKYYSYFENCHGEQWVFTYDPESNTGELRGGDAGWENAYIIQDGQAEALVLNAEEKMWLAACWKAATAI
jgi:hypothetical protein